MAKRQATEQITREAFHDDVSDDNEERPKLATSLVLAQRKILKPRGKLGDGNGSIKKSAFQIPLSTFQFNPSTTTSSAARPKANDEANKIKALNLNFINKINESNKENAIADFSPIAEKYISYFKEIKNGTLPNDTRTGTAQSDKIQEDQSSSDDESGKNEDIKEVKVEGPKFSFTPKPTSSSSSPFTFDPKKIAKLNEKDSDDSEEDVPIQGPTFKFDKPIQDNVFKLQVTPKTNNEVDKSSEKANSGSTQSSSQVTYGSNKQPTSSVFGSVSNSGFSFVTKPTETNTTSDQKKEVTKSFDIKSLSNQSGTSGLFKFGSTQPAFGTSSTENASTPFSFGAKADQSVPELASTPSSTSNNFGSKSVGNTSSVPAFNFGAKQGSSGPLVGSENASNSGGAAFTSGLFGSKSAENTTAKPFQFGGSASFKTNASSTPFTSNTFSKSASDKPTLPDSSKTGFLFGQKPESTSATTALSPSMKTFENANSGNAPANNPFGGLGSTNFQWGKQSEPSKEKEKKDDDKVEEHEVEGNFAPVVQMNEKQEIQSGEENEETKFTIRAKLMEFDASNSTNPYVNKGLGELKVLRNKETSKSRIIIRADGSLRVLLNTLLSKDISYSSMGNGSLVRIPVFSGENKIETYVVKVKTADDGKELLETIDELKS